jgi:hypothetical protein
MNGQTVPNDSQPTADVPLKMLQELDDLRGLDAAGKKPEIEVPYREASHGREALPVE